ncbi:hypothetical protein CPB86DRAFT_700958 [Serendipita vermifera]|nr:hypothetical protein CPB86DRAFT_700958 [Serendipita vermifera]
MCSRITGHTSQSLPGKNARIYFSTRHEMHYGFNNASDHAINYRGVVYRTAEHLYQALKFLDHEPIIAELVRRAIEPRRAAQKYDHQKRPDWAKLERVLFLKFDTYPGLKKDLLATGEAQLIQVSSITSRTISNDDNEFGGVLMKVRDTLRANKSPDLLGTRI